MTDPATLSLVEVATAIRDRKLSSVEVTRALLARIERWQPVLNAFVRVEAEEALTAAAAADAANSGGAARGPLHGVPLAHKDMFYIAGKITECGSKIRAGSRQPLRRRSHACRARCCAARRSTHGRVVYARPGTTSTSGRREPRGSAADHRRLVLRVGRGSARLTYAAPGSTQRPIRLPAHFCGGPASNRPMVG